MVVSDFDGTLLRSDDTVSPRTLEAIRAYVQAGGIFTVSTGRMYASIVARLHELGIGNRDVPLMAFQGALVRRVQSGKEIFRRPLCKKTALDVVREAEQRGIYCQVYSFDRLYVAEENAINAEYCKVNRIQPVVVGRLSEFLHTSDFEIPKVLLSAAGAEMERATACFTEKFSRRAQVFAAASRLLEVVSPEAGKGNGIEAAGRACGIDCDRIMAVGDAMNDLSMVLRAGLGVAMGNATEGLKAHADFVTDTNDRDGLAKAIEKFCL